MKDNGPLVGKDQYDFSLKAARSGNLDLFKSLISNVKFNSSEYENMARSATRGGHKNILDLIYDHVDDSMKLLCSAARSGNVNLINYIIKSKKNTKIGLEFFKNISRSGRLDVLIKFFSVHEITRELALGIIYSAAEKGHLHIVKYILYLYGVDIPFIADSAASGGQLHIIKWCVNNEEDLSGTASAAAQSGHSYILKWIMKKGLFLKFGRVTNMSATIGEKYLITDTILNYNEIQRKSKLRSVKK